MLSQHLPGELHPQQILFYWRSQLSFAASDDPVAAASSVLHLSYLMRVCLHFTELAVPDKRSGRRAQTVSVTAKFSAGYFCVQLKVIH